MRHAFDVLDDAVTRPASGNAPCQKVVSFSAGQILLLGELSFSFSTLLFVFNSAAADFPAQNPRAPLLC